jgi:tyrosine-protein phosphatase SIW14
VNNTIFFRLRAALLVAVALPVAALAGTAVPGVGNFQKLNDHVYRGAQPTERGFQNLAKLGIATVIDLQEAGPRGLEEEKWVKAAGMRYISIPMEGMQTPSNESVAKALALLENASAGPVFVHCHRGADRTGGVIACYRIEHDHWTNDQALNEAGSMGMSWYQLAIRKYVRNYRPSPPVLATATAPATAEAAAVLVPASE